MLAPEKDHRSVYLPMRYIREGALETKSEITATAPRFAWQQSTGR